MSALIERLRNVRVYGASLEGVVVPMGVNPTAIEAAAEITRLTKHVATMLDVADQRDQIIMDRNAEITRLKARVAEIEADRAQGNADYLALVDRHDALYVENCRLQARIEVLEDHLKALFGKVP